MPEPTVPPDLDKNQILECLLAPPELAFLAIVGTNAADKSELLDWLQSQLNANPNYFVLNLPADATLESLRANAEKFASPPKPSVPPPPDSAIAAALFEKLADAVSATFNPPAGRSDVRQYLIENLPSAVRDTVFQSVAQPSMLRIFHAEDSAPALTSADLPSNMLDFDKASPAARELLGLLINDDDVRNETLAFLNEKLSDVLVSTHNLFPTATAVPTPTHSNPLESLRAVLQERGKQLAIFVSDFDPARPLDPLLMEAFSAASESPFAPRKEAPTLCPLRLAVASAPPLPEVLRTRATFVVDLDLVAAPVEVPPPIEELAPIPIAAVPAEPEVVSAADVLPPVETPAAEVPAEAAIAGAPLATPPPEVPAESAPHVEAVIEAVPAPEIAPRVAAPVEAPAEAPPVAEPVPAEPAAPEAIPAPPAPEPFLPEPARENWSQYFEDSIPIYKVDVLELLERLPRYAEASEALRLHLTELEEFRSRPPQNREQLERFERAREEAHADRKSVV